WRRPGAGHLMAEALVGSPPTSPPTRPVVLDSAWERVEDLVLAVRDGEITQADAFQRVRWIGREGGRGSSQATTLVEMAHASGAAVWTEDGGMDRWASVP